MYCRGPSGYILMSRPHSSRDASRTFMPGVSSYIQLVHAHVYLNTASGAYRCAWAPRPASLRLRRSITPTTTTFQSAARSCITRTPDWCKAQWRAGKRRVKRLCARATRRTPSSRRATCCSSASPSSRTCGGQDWRVRLSLVLLVLRMLLHVLLGGRFLSRACCPSTHLTARQ